jgi:protein SCO1/2
MPPTPAATLPARAASRPLSRTLQWVVWSALGLLMAGILVSFVRQQWVAAERRAAVTLDHFGQVPAFELTERSGKPFSSAGLKGKIWLADFFFTACPGPCLLMNARLAEIGQAIQSEHADVQLVSFSIAPEMDTPAVLRKYAERFQAPPADRWSFLTGDHAKIYDIAQHGFLLPLVDNGASGGDPAPQFIHSTRISLVDRAGVVRGTFDSTQPEVTQQVLTAIGQLLREQPPAPGSPRA